MRFNLRRYIPRVKSPQIKRPTLSALKVPRPILPRPHIGRMVARRLVLLRSAIRKCKPDIKLSAPKLPKPKIPQLTLPKVTFPKVTFPSLAFPKLPAIKAPQIPRFEMPEVKLPPYNKKASRRYASATICALFITSLFLGNVFSMMPSIKDLSQIAIVKKNAFAFAKIEQPASPSAQTLNAVEPAAGYAQLETSVIEPDDEDLNDGYKYEIEQSVLEVETVLVPHATTVISSSRDSKIKSINFDNGERFKKGDILVEYTCADARAEVEIAKTQRELAEEKKTASYKLFKLDIISNIERLELETETKQAEARAALQKSRLEDCFIRAEYDGRVVKRLANAGEFTRTDRVLMEVASLETLKAEFLLPSRWLRWINIGAPIDITIEETGETYNAEVSHIYGEVDPISQSIQITAQLDKYNDPLLPGMSGTSMIDIEAIRRSGIIGFLEAKPAD